MNGGRSGPSSNGTAARVSGGQDNSETLREEARASKKPRQIPRLSVCPLGSARLISARPDAASSASCCVTLAAEE